jgi:hypothetical protein
VIPGVAKVVLVSEVGYSFQYFVQWNRAIVNGIVTIDVIVLVWRAVACSADLVLMKMRIGPPHDGLDGVVQLDECRIAFDPEFTPYERINAFKFDAKAIQAPGVLFGCDHDLRFRLFRTGSVVWIRPTVSSCLRQRCRHQRGLVREARATLVLDF